MKRSPALIRLSRDHHRALDVARRLRRATPDDLDAVLEYLREFWDPHGRTHFELEERHLVDALDDTDWREAASRMCREHDEIRACIASVAGVDSARELGTLLHDHVRFEERELFALLEDRLTEAQLAEIAVALEE
jgi:hemerythrin-like domain-containing protein